MFLVSLGPSKTKLALTRSYLMNHRLKFVFSALLLFTIATLIADTFSDGSAVEKHERLAQSSTRQNRAYESKLQRSYQDNGRENESG